jgi:hypothetical protein
MANKPQGNTAGSAEFGLPSFFQFGNGRGETMMGMQSELLHAYEEASRAWVARVKSEVELWSDLATKLTASRSVPEGMEAYRDCVAQRMQMAAEDGRRLFEDGQKIIGAVTRSLSQGLADKTK